MVGQITSVLASYGINIHNMINKSKGDLAYNILDLDSSLNDEVLILLTKNSWHHKSQVYSKWIKITSMY